MVPNVLIKKKTRIYAAPAVKMLKTLFKVPKTTLLAEGWSRNHGFGPYYYQNSSSSQYDPRKPKTPT